MTRLVAGLVAALLLPSLASAQPRVLGRGRVALGQPAVDTAIRVEIGDEITVIAEAAGRSARAAVAVPGATGATIEAIELGRGRKLGLVRIEGERRGAALITVQNRAPVVLWTGRLDMSGDPGERTADVIEVADRTGDGVADVIVGVRSENVRICGNEPALLFARGYDPARNELRPIDLRRLETAQAVEVEAVEDPAAGAPVLRGFHATSTSSYAGGGEDPTLLSPPAGLTDGSPDTSWIEGRPGSGRYEFATGRWSADGIAVTSIAITLPPLRAGELPLVAPRTLWIASDSGPLLHVSIAPAVPASSRVFVRLPEPRPWRCVSVVLDEARSNQGHVAIAELELFSELDGGAGLERLIETLVADGSHADAAVGALSHVDHAIVERLTEAWPTLTPLGRKRVARIYAAHLPDPRATTALALALRDDDVEVRVAALEAASTRGDNGLEALRIAATDPTEAGDAAALVLGRVGRIADVEFLLGLLSRPEGGERPGLRRALRESLRSGTPEVRANITRFVESDPPVSALASLALAIGSLETARSELGAVIARALPRAERFEDRYRLAEAAGNAPASGDLDAWLAEIATDAEEWMLRASALRALKARVSESPAYEDALDDPYPRVRVAAIEALAGNPRSSTPRLIDRVENDRWPMVRAAGLRALAGREGAASVARRALADDALLVRAAAISALTEARDRTAAPLIAERFEDDGEWPLVLEAAIEYTRTLCVPELVDGLGNVVARGLRTDAWEPDVEIAAVAIQALGELGGERAEAFLRRAMADTAPASLRDAARRALRATARCGR